MHCCVKCCTGPMIDVLFGTVFLCVTVTFAPFVGWKPNAFSPCIYDWLMVIRASFALRDGCTIHSPCVKFTVSYTHLACLGACVLCFIFGSTLQWEHHCNPIVKSTPGSIKEERVHMDLMS